MKNLIIGVALVAVLALGTFLLIQSNSSKKDKSSEESTATKVVSELTITYTDSGFSPETAIIKSGGKVTWVNESNSELQVGVNPHPSHTGDKEITGGEFVLSVGTGEKKTVTVEKKGTFGYHNHLSSLDSGTIKVE